MARDRGSLFTLLACLVVVTVVAVTAPDPATDLRRAWDDVTVGEWGQMDHASVRVEKVRRTQTATTSSDRTFDSDATFVVVDYTAAVAGQTVRFSEVALRTRDDHDYEPRPEFDPIGSLQPGFTRHGSLVFEVPDSRVEGAVLVVDPDGAAFDVYSRAIRVDLALAAGDPPAPGPVTLAAPVDEVTP